MGLREAATMDGTDPDTQVRQTVRLESNFEGCEVFNQSIILVSLHAYAGEVEVKFSGKLLKFGFLAFVLLCLSSLFAGFVFLLVGWQVKHECLQNNGITDAGLRSLWNASSVSDI